MLNPSVEEAVKLLKSGEVVGLPTETVYGLAGLISNEKALHKIFSTKERPFFDPLIVHVSGLSQAQDLAHWDTLSESLAQHFWPGPLTLILPKKDKVSELITSGGPTVGLRAPAHPMTQEILSQLQGEAFAAPSANRFGHTSPTEATHVVDEFSGKVPVVDGGPCQNGIESTVLQALPDENTVMILRPGVITEEDLQKFFDSKNKTVKIQTKSQTNAPGHLKNHYQPTVPLILFNENIGELKREDFFDFEFELPRPPIHWELPEQAEIAARQLYKDLRQFSQKEQPMYLVLKNSWENHPLWKALLDRIHKACHFYGHRDEEGYLQLTSKN